MIILFIAVKTKFFFPHFRAADWNLQTPDWIGRMRICSKGKLCYIKIEDKTSGELFAKCNVDNHPGIAVEGVLDSSRYFVLRIEDDTGNTLLCISTLTDIEPYEWETYGTELRSCCKLFTGRHAFIGLGFADRGDSFDFNVALQDHFK
ncbi:hypothetical protein QZH41_013844 [Actinostola sp. cb2023]|nr:hypothetical protein QZH41_013844 [Actinostola sp. cb2023]